MTQLRVAGGGSHYFAVIRDCDGGGAGGVVSRSYDVGIGIDHKFGGHPFMVGVNGGYLHDALEFSFLPGTRDYCFVNPNAGFMWRRFSFSLGAAWFSKKLLDANNVQDDLDESAWLPTMAVRIGDLKGFFATTSLVAGLPTYTGGAYFDVGAGWTFSERAGLWAGVNLAGLTATGGEARFQWRLSDRFFSDFGASVGAREGETQYSGNLGITYRIVH